MHKNSVDYALMERDQISLEVYSDLVKVLTTIKGKQQEYTYGSRNIVARIKDDVYNNMRYEQELNYSDYAYRKQFYGDSEYHNIDELEVYATYNIKIYNTSNEEAKITELLHYYDQGYDQIISSEYSYNGQNGEVKWTSDSKYANAEEDYENCNKIYTTSLEGIVLESGGELDIVITYKVGKDVDGVILGEKKIATEIYSYASEEGLIDIQSKPGNLNNREKDSDIGPILNLFTNNKSRIIQGFVWEEIRNASINNVTTGDGLYDSNNESKIDNIEVELVEKVTKLDGTADEYVVATMKSGNGKVTYSNNDGSTHEKIVNVNTGEYKFEDILPGEYIIRFTYGNNSEDYTYNGQDYKSTTVRGINTPNASDASDNKERRYKVLNIAKTMTYNEAIAFANPSEHITEYIRMVLMYADTESIAINIEHNNDQTNSVDFGLVKRPKVGLQITKEIQNIKLTNRGLTIVDTANGIMSGLIKIKDTTLEDIYKTFMLMLDDELIQGSELAIDYEIVVKNVGENDNLANYFAYDPAYGDVATQNALFATSADIVYDYTNTLKFNRENNPDWEQTTDYGILSSKTQNAIEEKEMLVTKTENLGARLLPGQTVAVDIQLSTLISAGRSELVYLNEVEIVQISNDGSRRDEEAIPGNYVPGDKEPNERDNWDTDLSITNPTGRAKTYYLLALVCAVILLVGIIAIKKFVIDEK